MARTRGANSKWNFCHVGPLWRLLFTDYASLEYSLNIGPERSFGDRKILAGCWLIFSRPKLHDRPKLQAFTLSVTRGSCAHRPHRPTCVWFWVKFVKRFDKRTKQSIYTRTQCFKIKASLAASQDASPALHALVRASVCWSHCRR